MHIPSSINNSVLNNATVVFYPAVPANYAVIGSPVTGDTFEQADRSQAVVIGSHIDTIIYNVSFRNIESDGVIEWAIFKIERAHEVPDGNPLLPTDTEIQTEGLQTALRRYQPGRVIKFGTVAVAPEQPRVISLKANYRKFKMSKIRTGDYYGMICFVRGITSTNIDFHGRYQSYN